MSFSLFYPLPAGKTYIIAALMVCAFLLEGGRRSRICQPFPHWSVPRPGRVATRLSNAMVTEHSERVTPGVISTDVRVRRHEPCSIIHLINVSRQLMNIHIFHLSDGEETEKKTQRIKLVEFKSPEDFFSIADADI